MSASKPSIDSSLLDPADDAPELTDELFDIAEHLVGSTLIRPARGYFGPNGAVHGRPPTRGLAKR